MQDLLIQIMGYAVGAWRFRWFMMLVAWVICLGGWGAVYMMPDVYQSNAKVFVDTQSMLRPLLRGLAVDVNSGQRLAFMTRNLLSRPNLEKVARMTDMDLKVKDQTGMDRLVSDLGKRIKVKASRGNIYDISFTDSDPQLAKRVVQSLLNIFVESTLGANRKDTDLAQQFLEQQIREYESRLEAAETRLRDFKRKNVGMMPGQGGGYFKRLETVTGKLKQARLKMTELEQRRAALLRQLESERPELPRDITAGSIDTRSEAVRLLDARIEAMSKRMDELLLTYTEKHPDVIALKDTIKQLQEQKLKELKVQVPKDESDKPEAATNPVYQQLRVALGETEAQLAAVRVRVRNYEERIEKLKKLVDTIPQVEAELARLNRDYAINQKNYQAFLSRLESARISQEAEQSSDSVKFKVIEPPRVPVNPSGPNRPLFFSAVLVGGLMSGMGLAILLSLTRPIFDSRKVLENVTGLPVLGSVSMVWNRRQKLRQRISLITFSVAGISLISLYGGIMVLQILDINPVTIILRSLPKI
jgi:polysaccharide chain length determinant protein (PEP-CTERM system associated)